MSDNYFKDMETIDNIIKDGNNYNRYNQFYKLPNSKPLEPKSNMNPPNPNLNVTPSNDGMNSNAYNPTVYNKYKIDEHKILPNKDPQINSISNPLFKQEQPNPFLGRMSIDNSVYKNENKENKDELKEINKEEKIKEDFSNSSNNSEKPTIKLFILGIIICLGFIVGLSWHEVSKYYIARSIKFYRGSSLYYVYYACFTTILFAVVLIINYFSK